jgi:hypothetical protein
MEALWLSELALLEWRMRDLSIGEWKGQEERAVGAGGVYIGSLNNLAVGPRFKIRTKSG